MPPRPSRNLCSLSTRANDTCAIRNLQWLQTHSFSTTTPKALPAPPKKKTSTSGPPQKGGTVLRIKKRVVQQSTARPPAPGERKALRKRIVLSNTNALEVPGLQEMGTGTLPSEASIGAVMVLPGDVVDSLRAVEAFKSGQGWSFFRRPACLVRKENVELSKIIDSHDGKTTRKIICGEKGVGKSVFLLEAMAMAFMKGWLVLNIPEGRELTIGHTAYSAIPNTKPLQYLQPTYTANLLSQFLKANKTLLSTLQLTSEPDFNFPLAEETTLATLAEAGSQDEDRAWPIFQHIWRELQVPGRPPVLYCIDNISHIMGDSKYTFLNEEDKLRPIHAHDFVLVKHFIDHLSGQRKLANGGMVLGATSLSEHLKSAALDTAIKAAEARQENERETRVSSHYDPYQKLDMRALKALTSDFEASSSPLNPNEVPDAPVASEAADATATSEPTPEQATSVASHTGVNELGVASEAADATATSEPTPEQATSVASHTGVNELGVASEAADATATSEPTPEQATSVASHTGVNELGVVSEVPDAPVASEAADATATSEPTLEQATSVASHTGVNELGVVSEVPDAPVASEAADATATSGPTPEQATSVATHTGVNELGVVSEVPDAPVASEAADATATSGPTPEQAPSVATHTGVNELGVIRLKGISKAEAKTILEYWATSGMVRRQIEEKFVADQWTVAGGGVFKELERGCLRRAV
ncbi:Ribosomal protein S23/S29 mitochondrial [Venturia nashicola]|uniref:Small ribosomal subunit protein mS29 n=1 Tax=Venturia nashicola TaxID=86259 RepID=A0A4Z1PNK5_9PEZI|nr:Ribosomal protein S23/S29 mitochondrial [Venturia nashicola]